MGHRGIRLCVALALLLSTAACGARLSDAQKAAATNRGTRAATTGGAALQSATTTTIATGAAAVDTGGGTSGGPSSGSTGGGATGTSDGDLAAPGAPCTSSGEASDVGVTADSIKAASVATISGPVPGLFKNVQEGVKAYFNYINSQGGVCGRKLEILLADDRLDAGTNRAQTESLAPQSLAFVGSYSVVDDAGASVLAGTGIPDIGSGVGARRAAMAENFAMTPTDPSGQTNGAQAQLRYFMDHYGISRGAIVGPAQPDARARGIAYQHDMESVGLPMVDYFEVAVTETNYTGVATKMKQDGIDFFITVLEINGIGRLLAALDQVGYHPKVSFPGQQAYGPQLIAVAGSAANGALLALGHTITEQKDSVPEMAALVEWYSRTNPGSAIDFFAIQGWIAGVMFVDALKMAGPSPTRAKVLEALGTFHDYDAHGLIKGSDPAGKHPSGCFQIVTVENQQFKVIDPAGGGFICP